MERGPKTETAPSGQSPAAEHVGAPSPETRGPSLAGQTSLIAGIQDSSRQVAQREKLKEAFGADRLEGKAQTGVVQRVPNRTAAHYQDWVQERTARQQLHQQNQTALYAMVNQPDDILEVANVPGLHIAREAILHNTKEYARRGLAISAMTPTLSTQVRPPVEFQRFWPQVPDEAYEDNLFFDNNVAFPTLGSDNKAAEGLSKADAGVFVRDSKETAHADGITIRVFMTGGLNADALKIVLIHEIQHAIDKHGGDFQEAVLQDINGQAGDVGNAYRSEFRAYWLGDRGPNSTFGSPNMAATNQRTVKGSWWPWISNQATQFQNERQENIFWHMCGSDTYPWVQPNYLQSAAFRALVNGMATPTGGNLINSDRIDGLRNSLGMARNAGFSDHFIQDVLDEAGRLDPLDRFFLLSNAAAPFWTFYDNCFNVVIPDQERATRAGILRDHVREIIRRV